MDIFHTLEGCARSRGQLLEFDDVAFRIANINRKSHASRAVAGRDFADHFDGVFLEIAHHRRYIGSLDPEAYVIDVEVGRLASRLRGDQIDHAAAGAKLNQPDVLEAALLG